MGIEERAKVFADKHFDHNEDNILNRLANLSYVRGALEQRNIDLKELVHESDDEEGITAQELKHQLYGYNYLIKQAEDWIRENIGDKAAAEFITAFKL